MGNNSKNILPFLEIKKIQFSFGNWVSQEFNIKMHHGDFHILKGSSGSGKSSLVRAILGLTKYQEGEIFCFGKKVNEENINEIRKNISWLPQNLEILKAPAEDSSSLGFIKNILEISNINFNLDKTEELLSELNLKKSLLKSDFSNLSLGERQRIGLVVCAIRNKKICLLDEPTSSLDVKNSEGVVKFIKEHLHTSLIISHSNLAELDNG